MTAGFLQATIEDHDTFWELFITCQRRLGWVEFFIRALRICEWPGLPERVTKSYLPPGTPLCSLTPLEPPTIPATASGPSTCAPGHSIPDNGYQEKPGCPKPVQDTKPTKVLRREFRISPTSQLRGHPKDVWWLFDALPNLQTRSP